MNKCPNCGFVNKDGIGYCQKCGTTLGHELPPISEYREIERDSGKKKKSRARNNRNLTYHKNKPKRELYDEPRETEIKDTQVWEPQDQLTQPQETDANEAPKKKKKRGPVLMILIILILAGISAAAGYKALDRDRMANAKKVYKKIETTCDWQLSHYLEDAIKDDKAEVESLYEEAKQVYGDEELSSSDKLSRLTEIDNKVQEIDDKLVKKQTASLEKTRKSSRKKLKKVKSFLTSEQEAALGDYESAYQEAIEKKDYIAAKEALGQYKALVKDIPIQMKEIAADWVEQFIASFNSDCASGTRTYAAMANLVESGSQAEEELSAIPSREGVHEEKISWDRAFEEINLNEDGTISCSALFTYSLDQDNSYEKMSGRPLEKKQFDEMVQKGSYKVWDGSDGKTYLVNTAILQKSAELLDETTYHVKESMNETDSIVLKTEKGNITTLSSFESGTPEITMVEEFEYVPGEHVISGGTEFNDLFKDHLNFWGLPDDSKENETDSEDTDSEETDAEETDPEEEEEENEDEEESSDDNSFWNLLH